MFEPDGRNSIQFVGHLTVQVVRGFFIVQGIIIITPLIIFLWCRGAYSTAVTSDSLGIEGTAAMYASIA